MTEKNVTNLLVRDSSLDDVEAIHAIYAREVVEQVASFEEEPPSVAEMARRREHVLSQGFPYLVAEVDGEVVGYCYASVYRARPSYRFTCENSIYVRVDWQARGVGRAMLAALIPRCEALGLRQMIAVISTSDTEGHGSMALHASFGFERVGTLKSVGFKFDRWIDTTFMQLAMQGEADTAH